MRFSESDFTDGSKAGSDPYDNPYPQYQRPAPWSSPSRKALVANSLVAFIEGGFKREHFTDVLYDGLSGHLFGHVAEFTIHGFYGSWFETPQRRAAWVERTRMARLADETRPRLYGDVERAILRWLNESGVGDRIIAAGVEADEREELARALATFPRIPELVRKYPDVVAADAGV